MSDLNDWANLKRLRSSADATVFVNQAKIFIERRLGDVLKAAKVKTEKYGNLSDALRTNVDLLPTSFKDQLPALLALLKQFAAIDYGNKNFGFDDNRPVPDLNLVLEQEDRIFVTVIDLLKPTSSGK